MYIQLIFIILILVIRKIGINFCLLENIYAYSMANCLFQRSIELFYIKRESNIVMISVMCSHEVII